MCSLRKGLTVLPTSAEDILTSRGLISSSERVLSQLSLEGWCWGWCSWLVSDSLTNGEEAPGPVPTAEGIGVEEDDVVEFGFRDEAGAWRCIEAEVEVVDSFERAEEAGAEEAEEGRWPLTSIWRSMAQLPWFWGDELRDGRARYRNSLSKSGEESDSTHTPMTLELWGGSEARPSNDGVLSSRAHWAGPPKSLRQNPSHSPRQPSETVGRPLLGAARA